VLVDPNVHISLSVLLQQTLQNTAKHRFNDTSSLFQCKTLKMQKKIFHSMLDNCY